MLSSPKSTSHGPVSSWCDLNPGIFSPPDSDFSSRRWESYCRHTQEDILGISKKRMGLVQPTPGRGCRDGAGMAAVVEKDNRQEASRRLTWLCPDLPEQSCTFITYRRSEGPLWMVMNIPPPVHSTWQEAACSDISEWREYADAEMTWFAWSGQGRGVVREVAEQRRERKPVCVSSCAAGRGERLALGAAPPTPHPSAGP